MCWREGAVLGKRSAQTQVTMSVDKASHNL